MNKDVIYIDVDDDVTAIIGKIKKAKEKIVALVPPKRVGTLQSAVNLRLLERMAKNDKKQLVLITNNPALVALAANAKIPVAKNLQSKPEIAEIPAIIVDDGDDIIDGNDIPVGEHADTVPVKDGTRNPDGLRSDAIGATDLTIDGESVAASAVASSALKRTAKKGKNRPKIPNFDSFRKRLLLIATGGAALIALLIWMFGFAPAATVIITASTTPTPVTTSLKLGGTAATDYKTGIISSLAQQEKKDEVVDFTATGEKDVGNQAAGTVRFSTNSISSLGTIPAGTQLRTTSGKVFTTDEAVTLTISNYTGTNVTMTALGSGEDYNGATGSMTGAPSGVSAAVVGTTSGGTTQIVKVVSADDIERANGQLVGASTDEVKKALAKKFTNGEKVIDSSFTVERAAAVSAPGVNQPTTDGKAKLTISTTYTIQAVTTTDLESYLKNYLGSKIDTATQKIYSTGTDKATLSNFRKDNDVFLVTLNANGNVGPKIDEDLIKEDVKGKKYGEVQQTLTSQDGIKDVDVKFSYFWVRTVPGNTDKIKIEFKIDDDK